MLSGQYLHWRSIDRVHESRTVESLGLNGSCHGERLVTFGQDLGRPKVDKFEDGMKLVGQDVAWFDISVLDALRIMLSEKQKSSPGMSTHFGMQVLQSVKHLVGVPLDDIFLFYTAMLQLIS